MLDILKEVFRNINKCSEILRSWTPDNYFLISSRNGIFKKGITRPFQRYLLFLGLKPTSTQLKWKEI